MTSKMMMTKKWRTTSKIKVKIVEDLNNCNNFKNENNIKNEDNIKNKDNHKFTDYLLNPVCTDPLAHYSFTGGGQIQCGAEQSEEGQLAQAAALQSVAVRPTTGNDVSSHYFHRYFLFLQSSVPAPAQLD